MSSGFFQGTAQPDGKVLGYDVHTGVPFGSQPFRGGLREQLGSQVFVKDTGQPRTFQNGMAFTLAGEVLYVEGDPGGGASHSGGIVLDQNGAVVLNLSDSAQTFLSGIGIRNNGRIPALAVYAGLFNEPLFQGLGYSFQNFRRDSEAVYQDVFGEWRIALVDEPRFEERMLLMEPGTTNKSTTYNANPDPALTGISGPVDLTRVYHPDQLARGGLTNVCQSGYLVNAHNPSGTKQMVMIAGVTGNENSHVASIFLRTFGTPVAFGVGADRGQFEFEMFTRAVHKPTSVSESDTLTLLLDPGTSVQFLLAQLEEGPVVTSPIITEGMTANRAPDTCRWDQPGS